MSNDLGQLTEKRKRWVEANRENGFEDGIKRLLTELYPDNAHFIYELLQNAEDTQATEVCFTLNNNELEFEHNGTRLFSFENVDSITSIGVSSKRDDPTSIGKFGVGFKAVFAYTNTPQIHSGDYHFRIDDLVVPEPVEPCQVGRRATQFIFPFNHQKKSVTQAETEITKGLWELGDNTLLFLKHIKKIEFLLPDGSLGHQERIEHENGRIEIHTLRPDGEKLVSHWLRFEKVVNVADEDDKGKDCRIAIAYSLMNSATDDKQPAWKVTPLERGQVSIFFPAEKETSGLRCHIHAPFASTVARDSVRNCEANKTLTDAIADLTVNSLLAIRDQGLFNITSYTALPLRGSDFSPNEQGIPHLFRSVYDRVREAIKTEPLLLAQGGDFIKADEAKLARGKELVEFFSPEQLGQLFGKERLVWLDATITESGATSDLYAYLVGLVDGMQVTPESLAPKLTDDFLSKQAMDWLIRFIQYAIDGAQKLKEVPFIRLASGGHVSLPSNKSTPPSAWFSPKDMPGIDLSEFPLIHAELSASEPIRKFLEEKGIREIDAAAIVGKCILPLYNGVDTPFDEPNYRDHLRLIRQAYTEANDAAKKEELIAKLNDVAWLACVHASSSAPDKFVWKKPGASDVFAKSIEHEKWFYGLENIEAYFLHQSVGDELNGVVTSLVKFRSYLWETKKLYPTPLTEPIDPNRTQLTEPIDPNRTHSIRLKWLQNDYKQAQGGFHPDAEICGLSEALRNPSMERTKILWDILIKSPHLIQGVVLCAKTVGDLSSAQRIPEFSKSGKILVKTGWLPDQAGNFRKPNELFLADLPATFDISSIRAKEVAEKLGMRKPEVEQAAETLSKGDPRKKLLLEQIANASDDDLDKFEKLMPRTVPPMPAPSFKDGLANMTRQQRGTQSGDDENIHRSYPVSNPDHRQNNLNQAVADGVQEHAATQKIIRFSPVRDQPSNNEARKTLYQEYQGRCQVTGKTFPKASANANGEAENYFEVCSLLPYGNADYLNDAGNMLCVSADTMAKLNHASFEWLDDIEHKIAEFDNGGKTAQEIKIRIRLAGEECDITWRQRHFMRLVALYQKA